MSFGKEKLLFLKTIVFYMIVIVLNTEKIDSFFKST